MPSKKKKLNLVIDIGNTSAKIAVFQKKRLIETVHSGNRSLDELPHITDKYPIERGIISTVIPLSETIRLRCDHLPFPLHSLTAKTPLPIRNLYRTPETLGNDRLAAVVAAHEQCPGRNLLVIDAGTALTFDFIDAEGQYHGGNISPGLQMRLKALHRFTGRLPLVSIEEEKELPDFGYSTQTAIGAGVIQGINMEIAGYISCLKDKHPDLLIFLTGGDAFSFETTIKSRIFADNFLVLKGLNTILEYNADK